MITAFFAYAALAAIIQAAAIIYAVGKSDGYVEASVLALMTAPVAFMTLPLFVAITIIVKRTNR